MKEDDMSLHKDHDEVCLRVLAEKFPKIEFEMVSSFKSYMTGLKYHKTKPEIKKVYSCRKDTNNKYDKNAIKILYNGERIAFVPRDLCEFIANEYDGKKIYMVCYCRGLVTQKSAQCIYAVFEECK